MDPLLNQLKQSFPGRKYEIEQLYNLYAYKDEPFVDCVYIYGSSSTGKSAVVNSLLNGLSIKYASVNLVECYSSKVLFESILNQLSEHKIDVSKGQPYARCDNMMDFLFNLNKCAAEMNLNKSVIVLDKADRLRNMDSNLLPAFLRFRELSALPVSVIFISEIIFEKYSCKAWIMQPLKIHFPQYTKDQLLEILILDVEDVQDVIINNYEEEFVVSKEFYGRYLNLFLSVFYRTCRDLAELRHMSKLNFIQYCDPIFKKECKQHDSMGLWRHILPVFKASLEVLYLRISPANQERKQENREIICEGTQTSKQQFTFSKENLAQSLELPFYAKYLLMAAYLASYNPAKEDKRLFMKYHGKKTKRLADVKLKSKMSEKLNTQLGPKPFSFDRLVAIFYAILEEKVDFNSNLLVQISTLVELQLLSTASDNSDLDNRKYKCCVGYEFVQTIAKTLDFNIRRYLVDFNNQ